MELFDYAGLRREQECERRRNNDPVQLSIGISTTEMCGLAPSRVLGSLDYGAGGWEAATTSACWPPARSRSPPVPPLHGQGHETAFSQIVAGQAGVPLEDVETSTVTPRWRQKGLTPTAPIAGYRRRHAISQRRRSRSRRRRRSPRTPLEASEDDIEFGGVGSSPGHRQGQGDPGDRVRHVHGARPPGGHGALAGLGRRVRPGELLLPARHALRCAMEVDTETGWSTCGTSAVRTTSAT
ncbi:hypothetical protein HBB16_18375 [Pseudonocardia sp. MCCB 268]|nr:hypothetical protein [Pseudonocardia cytotoxica]